MHNEEPAAPPSAEGGLTLPEHQSAPRRKRGESREKDWWDKFSTLSTLLSTILIAAVGGWFTHRFEEHQAEEQKKIQETQVVAQLMPFMSGTDQQQKRAFVAIKILGNTKLMVDLAASDARAAGAREALRDVEFGATTQSDKDLAISVLRQFEFAPSCPLPFKDVAVNHPIDFSDQSCGMAGESRSDPLRAQNLVKNNFCSGTNFRDLSTADFLNLQQQTQFEGSATNLPIDRAAFRKLGEGTAVRFVGFIASAHYSDVSRGESVNCNLVGSESNDIHVNMVGKPDENDLCQSITAEISPHMRPNEWEMYKLQALADQKTLVRIGGQLMYDASHVPCSGGSKVMPPRISSWEIHPVYSIEVCPTAQHATCPQGGWVRLALPPTR